MKLKSLFLGSAAALALTSGALAADPRSSFVSLDVCDAYGITGLTIASSDTCLKISGHVDYQFRWGDYHVATDFDGTVTRGAPGGSLAAWNYFGIENNDGANDWRSRLETRLNIEATTQTDAGAARVNIVLRERNEVGTWDQDSAAGTIAWSSGPGAWGHNFRVQDAWVTFGDTTVLMAGRKATIAKLGNDESYTYLRGFVDAINDDRLDQPGVIWSHNNDTLRRGGASIQVVSEVADGVSVGLGLESLDGATANLPALGATRQQSRGTLVGFVEAKGGWGEAHATFVAADILVNNGNTPVGSGAWGFHTGGTFNFDNFKVRGALATDNTGFWNALLTGEAAFDLFTLAATAEFGNYGNNANFLGLGNAANDGFWAAAVSGSFQATETVKINAGFRYLDINTNVNAAVTQSWQAALGLEAELAEGITATAQVGARGAGLLTGTGNDPVAYVDLGLNYAPGGGFETGVGLEANALGAYQVRFNAKKTF